MLFIFGFGPIFTFDPLLGGGDILSPIERLERPILGSALIGLGLALIQLQALKPSTLSLSSPSACSQ